MSASLYPQNIRPRKGAPLFGRTSPSNLLSELQPDPRIEDFMDLPSSMKRKDSQSYPWRESAPNPHYSAVSGSFGAMIESTSVYMNSPKYSQDRFFINDFSEVKQALMAGGDSDGFQFDRIIAEQEKLLSNCNNKMNRGEFHQQQCDYNHGGHATRMPSCSSMVHSFGATRMHTSGGMRMEPTCMELYPGQNIRILPPLSKHALMSISNDETKVYLCAGCGIQLAIPGSARVFYCPGCNFVTSTDAASTPTVGRKRCGKA